jgi:O-antigen/teichoic acid export membrane protein
MFWSFLENFSKLFLSLFVSIILARMLTPNDFGLIGITGIFISISSTFVDSGFGQALIRKREANEDDYSTVFYFNIFISIFFYIILFSISRYISIFFNEPELILIIKLVSINIVIGAIGSVQQIIFTKTLNFKIQTQVAIFASIISGSIAIILAYNNLGVYSIIWSGIINQVIISLLFWFFSKWRPKFVFSFNSFNQLFSFGSKLLYSSLLNTIFNNIYYVLIGKFFSSNDLGLYTRAENLQKLPSQNITAMVQKVSYPILSSISNDKENLRKSYITLMKTVMFVTTSLMCYLIVVSDNLFIVLFGNQWLPSIIYFKLLCFVGVFYPMHAISLNLITVMGRSDIFLKLEIVKKILAIPTIIIGYYLGITPMIYSIILLNIISFFLNTYFVNVELNYSIIKQLMDIKNSFFLAIIIYLTKIFNVFLVNLKPILFLTVQSSFILFVLISFCEIFRIKEYKLIKAIIIEKVIKK